MFGDFEYELHPVAATAVRVVVTYAARGAALGTATSPDGDGGGSGGGGTGGSRGDGDNQGSAESALVFRLQERRLALGGSDARALEPEAEAEADMAPIPFSRTARATLRGTAADAEGGAVADHRHHREDAAGDGEVEWDPYFLFGQLG